MNYLFYNKQGDLTPINSPKDQKLIASLLLEYIIALAVEWHVENEKSKNSLFQFSGSTRAINANTFLFYPFYFTTANGHSKALFNSSGSYIGSSLGPVSEYLLEETKFKDGLFKCELTYFTITTSRIILKNDIKEVGIVKSEIENTYIGGADLGIQFKDLMIQKDDETGFSKLINAIDKSKDALKIQSNNKFLNYDVEHFKNFGQGYYNLTIGEKIDYQNVIKDRIFNPINF